MFQNMIEVSSAFLPQVLLLTQLYAISASLIFTSVAILVFRYAAYELHVVQFNACDVLCYVY